MQQLNEQDKHLSEQADLALVANNAIVNGLSKFASFEPETPQNIKKSTHTPKLQNNGGGLNVVAHPLRKAANGLVDSVSADWQPEDDNPSASNENSLKNKNRLLAKPGFENFKNRNTYKYYPQPGKDGTHVRPRMQNTNTFETPRPF